MGNYNVRLAKEDKRLLTNTARTYGAPNTTAFLREMIRCNCSDDSEDAHAFVDRVTEKITGQMGLPFTVGTKPQKPAQKALKPLKRKKGGTTRARPT